MPYKDKEKQREAQRKWANDNRSSITSYQKSHSRKNVETIRKLKESKPCMDCGNHYPYPAMQFDHLPGTEKLGNVSTMVSKNYSMVKVMEEISKCDLVCANCHAIRTATRKGQLFE